MLVNDFNKSAQAEAQILHPGTRRLFRYWETLRAERSAPRRDELTLQAMSAFLPNIAIIEQPPIPSRSSFRWRLAGSGVEKLFQRPLTGQDAFVFGDAFERDVIQKLYKSVLTQLQPCLLRFRLISTDGWDLGVEQLGLPLLSVNGGQIFILTGLFPFGTVEGNGLHPISRLELVSARTIWTEHLPGDQLVARFSTHNDPAQRFRVIPGGRVD